MGRPVASFVDGNGNVTPRCGSTGRVGSGENNGAKGNGWFEGAMGILAAAPMRAWCAWFWFVDFCDVKTVGGGEESRVVDVVRDGPPY